MWPFEYKCNVQCFWLKRILNIIIQAGIFREYRNKCFWRPKCFGKGTSSVYGIADIKREGRSSDYAAPAQFMVLRISSGKGEVQIMPFRKLSGKCHFLLRFCTRNWSETYVYNPRHNIKTQIGPNLQLCSSIKAKNSGQNIKNVQIVT